jgi:single-stranded DNA-binding protein
MLHIRVIAFNERAVQLAGRLSEGDRVVLSGRLRSEGDPEKPRTYTYSVIVAELCRVSDSEGLEQET